MLASTIIALVRSRLDDEEEPYLWETWELVLFYNLALQRLCRETKVLRDSSTTAICNIKLLAGVAEYTLSTYIIEVLSARLSSSGKRIRVKDERVMDSMYTNWRETEGEPNYIIPYYETLTLLTYPFYEDDTGVFEGSSDVNFTAPSTIGVAAGGFDDTELEAGDEIYISGASNTANNGYFTISTITDTDIVVTAATLTDEAGSSATIRKVEDTLKMTVYRLPSSDLTEADLSASPVTATPEIKADYHLKFLNGILEQAYYKRDTQTFDAVKAGEHKGLFELDIDEVKRAVIRSRHYADVAGPSSDFFIL